MNFLDLSQFQEETFDIKLPNTGEKVNIKKPTQKLYMDFIAWGNEGTENLTEHEQMKRLNQRVVKILNHNENGRKFTNDDIKGWHVMTKLAFIKGYTEFITEITRRKNS